MKRRVLAPLVIVLCLATAYAGYRIAVHEQGVHPAIVTPRMDAQQALSPSLAGRLKRLFSERVPYNRVNRPKLIALTFDDGPYPIFTPLLLDRLAQLKIPATFFLIGYDAQRWPELTRRIELDGNEIGNHTFTHPEHFDSEPAAVVRDEIIRGREALMRIVSDPAIQSYFRPPHGRYTLETIRVAQSLGYTTVLWTDDGGDWRARLTGAALAQHIEQFATSPDIVLLHSGRIASIEMLSEVAARFRRAGYRFVTVGELLARASVTEISHPAKHPV